MSFPTLPPTVPHLKEDGSNWATFAMHFQGAMMATQHWMHFDGTATCPTLRDAANPTSMEREAMEEWVHKDSTTSHLLNTRLADTTLLCIVATKQ